MKESTPKKNKPCGNCKADHEGRALCRDEDLEKLFVPSHEEWVEEEAAKAMKRIEKETSYDATQWNDMLVWEAGDADTVYLIIVDSLKEALSLGRKQGLEEARDRLISFLEEEMWDAIFTKEDKEI